jgi:hypothetical protein
MSTMLPGGLAWVLNHRGFQWPNVDEDKHESATKLLTSSNAGKSTDAFASHATVRSWPAREMPCRRSDSTFGGRDVIGHVR